MPTYIETGSGGVLTNGSAILVDNKNLTLLWNIRTKIEKDITFLWNIGSLKIFWYRVLSKPVDNTQCSLQGNNCPCQQFVVTLHARTLSELCQKLTNRNFNFPIESVQRFSRPAETSVVNAEAAAGQDNSCQQLIPITPLELSQIPACANFFIDIDFKTRFGFSMIVQIKAFLTAQTSGSVIITGSSLASLTPPNFLIGSGGVICNGSAKITPYIEGTASGVLVGGGQTIFTFFSPLMQMGFSMSITQVIAEFFSDVDLQNTTNTTNSLAECGCVSIPMTIVLAHNLATNNIFAQFLVRNNFNIPTDLIMRYNATNNSWQDNLHYRGEAADSLNSEAWDLVFELQCTNLLGGISLGEQVWKLAIQIFRKDLVTRERLDTRVIVDILPEVICAVTGNLSFKVSFDTQLGIATVSPNAVIYQNMIYDNIGLFKTPAWIQNPILILDVSQFITIPLQRVNLTNDVILP